MKKIIYLIFVFFTVLILSSCAANNDSDTGPLTEDNGENYTCNTDGIPTVIIIMNWTNFSDFDSQLWHSKFFDTSSNGINSVNRWYEKTVQQNEKLAPACETYVGKNDGIIRVEMNEAHPSKDNDIAFRDNQIASAIKKADPYIDFSNYDKDKNGFINAKELQIVFIVAGGEAAYSGSFRNSIWAHAWYFDGSVPAPTYDNVVLMNSSSTYEKQGYYAAFGSIHGLGDADEHKATIGIIAHELGHSLYDLVDLYDSSSRGSGLGYYDIMSNGTWGKRDSYVYAGETPTQFSSFSKLDMNSSMHIRSHTAASLPAEISMRCSSNYAIKLNTANPKEYFLLECRDSQRLDSDRAFNNVDNSFTTNRLFALLYHVDENKKDNTENGPQTLANHYKVRVIEKNVLPLMTSIDAIDADFSDVYLDGDVIDSSKTKSYSGAAGYRVEVINSDYNNRTMTFKITQ